MRTCSNRCTLAPWLIALVWMLWSAPARADWQLPRGDVARTGTARGVANLNSRAISWRHYLGGSIGDRGAQLHDVDDDGTIDVVFVSGGTLTAKRRNDTLLWQTEVYGISTIIGAYDFDGDGDQEFAVRSSSRVYLVDVRSGDIVWKSPSGDLSAVDDVRVSDLDGDGISDLLAQTCPCCRVAISGGGFAYRFADGFSASPSTQRMWALPDTSCGGRYSMALIDADGDGRHEVTFSNSKGIGLINAATGRSCPGGELPCEPCLQTAPDGTCEQPNPAYVPPLDLGARSNAAHCVPVDVDDRPGQELVCSQNNSAPEHPDDSHRMFALTYDPVTADSPAAWRILWQRVIGTRERAIAYGARPVVDLDGDGALEILVAGVADGAELWVTFVLDAATGAVLGSMSNQQIVGAVDLGPASGSTTSQTILTRGTDILWAWSFDRQATPRIRGRWSLADRSASLEPDKTRAASAYVSARITVRDVTGDDRPELFLVDTLSGALIAYDTSGFTPEPVAEFASPGTMNILEMWTNADEGTDDAARLFVATTDGVMRALDSGLSPLTEGLRFGGYYPKGDWRNLHVTPVIADLGNGVVSVVVSEARGALIRLDTADASDRVPPEVVWALPNTSSPSIVPGIIPGNDPETDDARPGIVCRQTTEDGAHRVQVVSGDGQVRRSVAIGSAQNGRLLSDIVPANLDGDDVPDLIVQWGEPGVLDLHIQGLSGVDLQSLWHTVPAYEGTTRFPAGGTVSDWNQDGVDDFIHQYYRTQILSGADGSILAETEQNGIYFMPIVAQLDDDDRPELVLQGGFNPIRALDDDLSAMWTSADDTRPYPYGSLVECRDGAVYLMEGGLAEPATLRRTRVDAAGLVDGHPQDTWSRVLAHGQMYANVSDTTLTDVFLGQLTSTVIHENLMGDERPVALVGSEDGYLYAVDVCSGGLVFTMPFGASVGAIAFGDTDGDDFDELLVAVADGYLYAIDDDGDGYKVGCQCGASGSNSGTSWLVLLVCAGLWWPRRSRSLAPE